MVEVGKAVRIKEVLAGPSSVGFRNKEWTDVAISVPREFPNSRGQGPDEDGCRQGIVPLKECDGLEVPCHRVVFFIINENSMVFTAGDIG